MCSDVPKHWIHAHDQFGSNGKLNLVFSPENKIQATTSDGPFQSSNTNVILFLNEIVISPVMDDTQTHRSHGSNPPWDPQTERTEQSTGPTCSLLDVCTDSKTPNRETGINYGNVSVPDSESLVSVSSGTLGQPATNGNHCSYGVTCSTPAANLHFSVSPVETSQILLSTGSRSAENTLWLCQDPGSLSGAK